jgi:hypothetical protein
MPQCLFWIFAKASIDLEENLDLFVWIKFYNSVSSSSQFLASLLASSSRSGLLSKKNYPQTLDVVVY